MIPIHKIQNSLLFINNYVAYDFRKNMGQLALEVNYTNGDMDMFTTPNIPRGSDKGDFKTEEEFYEAVEYLRKSNIPIKQK